MSNWLLLVKSLIYYWRSTLAVLLGVVAGTAVIAGALVVGDSVRYSLQQMTLQRLGKIDFALTGQRFFRQSLADRFAEQDAFSERFDAALPAIVMVAAFEIEIPEREPSPIVEVVPGGAGSAAFVIDGNYLHLLGEGESVVVAGSTGNDGTYTVRGGGGYEYGVDRTMLPVVEPVGDPTADGTLAVPALEAQAGKTRRAGKVNVYGVDRRVWQWLGAPGDHAPQDDGVVFNSRTARALQSTSGDSVTLWIELPSSVPRDSLLGDRDQAAREVTLSIAGIVPDNSGPGRFALRPAQQLPLNAFVALDTLQDTLDMSELQPTRRDPASRPARVNTLFVSARDPSDGRNASAVASAEELTDSVRSLLELEDFYLKVVANENLGYVSLQSDRTILETPLANAGLAAAEERGTDVSPVLVYLANKLANADDPDAFSMYSVIAGLDVLEHEDEPFGPFEFVGPRPEDLAGDEIVLNKWVAQDLHAERGDEIEVSYHVVGSHGELPEEHRTFRVAGVVKLVGPAVDSTLTPEVAGITDAATFGEWRQPFPMDLDAVTIRDEDYWDDYRALPKAFVSLETAQELWRSRYGELTSIRVAPRENETLADAVENYTNGVRKNMPLGALGMTFQPVKRQGLEAASGTTDFSVLFLAFSFFLILAATILIALLFRLGVERRVANIGLLTAVGLTPRRVRWLHFKEGLCVVIAGGLLGLAAGVAYARLMLYGLTNWWVGAIGTRFLLLDVEPLTLALGLLASAGVAAVALWWGLRQLRRVSTRSLLAGESQPELSAQAVRRRGRVSMIVAMVGGAIAVALIGAALAGAIPDSYQVATFMVVGLTLFIVTLAGLAAWLDADRAAAVRGRGLLALLRLAVRNAARHRQRTVFSVGLIASATFIIVVVAAAHRDPAAEAPDKDSGNGGYTLVAESSTPILYNLNTSEGRRNLDFRVDPRLADEERERRQSLLEQMQVMPFRVKPGEDASCLNLYQTRLPTILGVPQEMIERGGFAFVGADRENPWTILNDQPSDGSVPVLGDMNSLMYSLHKAVGDKLDLPGRDDKLLISGMFSGSVFQGVLLMSEENFMRLFPEQVGYAYFLIEIPPADAEDLAGLLETQLQPYGFDTERVALRLQSFLAVQNTYLSTFQVLGGLGLLLGTVGLGTVMLRNVVERRSELALLRALGFRRGALGVLVLCENTLLLIWGLLAGAASALLAMTPHLTSVGANVPWQALQQILAAVFLVGLLSASLAIIAAVRTPILASLRSE